LLALPQVVLAKISTCACRVFLIRDLVLTLGWSISEASSTILQRLPVASHHHRDGADSAQIGKAARRFPGCPRWRCATTQTAVNAVGPVHH
jgi:hypothetical protein